VLPFGGGGSWWKGSTLIHWYTLGWKMAASAGGGSPVSHLAVCCVEMVLNCPYGFECLKFFIMCRYKHKTLRDKQWSSPSQQRDVCGPRTYAIREHTHTSHETMYFIQSS
jgi:hypothetical protein